MKIQKYKFNPSLALTSLQMRQVDRVAVEEFNLKILQMMELAAFQMCTLIKSEKNNLTTKKVLVISGKGNNGGDAIACARILKNWGAEVQITAPKILNDNTRHHLMLSKKIGINITEDIPNNFQPDIIIDGLLGYSIKGGVRKPYFNQIQYINNSKANVYAFDLPSGLDPDDGTIHEIAVKATHTLTLAYAKKGLLNSQAKQYVGKLYIGDIGIPKEVYDRVKLKYKDLNYINPFLQSSIVEIDNY